MIEADQATFERAVLERSRTIAVLVDFWAPWCAPCRALGPLLERLETSFAGRFELVKVNADSSPQLSTRYQVRSIPYVLLFVDGEPVDHFVGALPEKPLREFIERALPGPAEIERRKARVHIENAELDAAAAALRSAIVLDPASCAAQLDLAELLLERFPPPVDDARLAEAAQALGAVSRAGEENDRWRALEARLSSLRDAASRPSIETLRARVDADPADLADRWALAHQYLAHHKLERTLDELIEIIARDRHFHDDGARKLLLSVLDLARDRPELVARYRRRLAALIHP